MAEIPSHWLHEETYGPRDVAKLFDVDPRTVTKWAQNGIIGFFRTPSSGLRRFPACEVRRVMQGEPAPAFLKELADQDKAAYHEKWKGGWRRGSTMIKVKDEDE